MTRLLLDTSVLIDHLRGYPPATDFLETVFRSQSSAMISTVTEMELFTGQSIRNEENRHAVGKLLTLFTIIPVNSSIARRAGILLQNYRHQGLTPIDAIIAGTAQEHEASLITRNIKHFRMVESIVVFNLPTDSSTP